MKVIYDKQTGTLLDASQVFVGDIDPMKQVTDEEMITEVLAQDRPLHEFENEKAAETVKDIESKKGCREPEVSQEQFVVWICYITDNYGNPLVVKVVSTETQAQTWLDDEPLSAGKKEYEPRGRRFVDRFVVEAE